MASSYNVVRNFRASINFTDSRIPKPNPSQRPQNPHKPGENPQKPQTPNPKLKSLERQKKRLEETLERERNKSRLAALTEIQRRKINDLSEAMERADIPAESYEIDIEATPNTIILENVTLSARSLMEIVRRINDLIELKAEGDNIILTVR